MSSERSFFVREYCLQLESDSAAAFVGAGMSAAAGYPGWKKLLEEVGKRLSLPETEDLVTLAQFVANHERGRHVIEDYIYSEFTKPRDLTAAHRELASLPIDTIWTTNYDDLLERSMAANERRPDVKDSQEQLPLHLPGRDLTIYKMHGHAARPHETVLTRDDYEDYARNRALFVDVLTADLLQKTFVFLGVSFTDPNVNFLMGRIRSIYGGAKKRHYWITAKKTTSMFQFRVEDLRRYGIHTVAMDSHDELASLLQQLRETYEMRRRKKSVFLSGSVKADNPQAETIRRFSILLAERLVREQMNIITGLGFGLGIHISNAALNVIYSKNQKRYRPDQVVARPFPHDPADGTEHRRRMAQAAGFAVFICGTSTGGVLDEYKLAREAGCCLIPVGATGDEAAQLSTETLAQVDLLFGAPAASVRKHLERLNDWSLGPEAWVDSVIQIIQLLRD